MPLTTAQFNEGMTRVIERNNNKNGSSNNNKANASLSAESVAST